MRSTRVLGFLGDIIVGEVWDLIKRHLFRPDTSVLDAIAGGIDHLETVIKDLDYADQLREPTNLITYWTRRMDEIMEDITEEIGAGKEPDLQAYDELCKTLRDEAKGVRFQTEMLYVTLMKANLPVGNTKPLIDYWQEQEYKHLSAESETSYHARDYRTILDDKITSISALLTHGMDLSFHVAYSEKDAERLRDECKTRVSEFRDRLWGLYPPGLKWAMQNMYDSTGLYLSDGHFFNFYPSDDTTGKQWLSIGNYWIRQLLLHTPAGDGSNIVRSFRFTAPSGPLGPFQMHAYWLSGNNSRVKFYDDTPAGASRTLAYTNSEKGGRMYTILFKMIPIAVPAGTADDKRPIRFVPYLEEGKTLTGKDRNNTWGNEWKLERNIYPQ